MHITNNITIAICNFNTTELTNNCISSIIDNSKLENVKYVILDNSDKTKFKLHDSIKDIDINIIDNTQNKYVNFDSIMKQSPYKLMTFNANNFGSLKHACSIQFLLNICQTNNMLLFDSDTILLTSIDFINDNYITISDLEETDKIGRNGKIYTSYSRTLPFIQYFNIKLINQHSIKYFDYSRMHGITAPNRGNYYDTGASFYADIVKLSLPFKRINHRHYVNHLDHGSWNDQFNKYLKK